MTGATLSAIIVACIAIAIVLGYKTGINTGLFCMIFAYIIGCFVMGLYHFFGKNASIRQCRSFFL